MTKYEMAMEIMKDVKWTEGSKKNRIKHLGDKERVKELYEHYLKDKEHALFYASLL